MDATVDRGVAKLGGHEVSARGHDADVQVEHAVGALNPVNEMKLALAVDEIDRGLADDGDAADVARRSRPTATRSSSGRRPLSAP